MCDMAGGWLRSLLGGFGGGKLYIWGVVGYDKPIWDVLTPEGEREEAGEHIYGPKLIKFFPIRQPVPGGLARARFWLLGSLALIFGCKKMYISRHNTSTCILPLPVAQGRQE